MRSYQHLGHRRICAIIGTAPLVCGGMEGTDEVGLRLEEQAAVMPTDGSGGIVVVLVELEVEVVI